MTVLPEIHKLSIFLKQDSQLFQIQEYVSDDMGKLSELGKERLLNNDQYVAVITSFSLVTAKMIPRT